MIKPNEIRVGNWVSHEFTGPFQWDWKHFADYVKDKRDGYELSHLGADAVISDKIEPMPLTPEILEKCGFEKDDEGFWLHDKDRVALQLEQQDYTDGSFDYHCGIRFDIGMPFNDLLIGMQHVHQLQNLYHALTGEELEINL